MPLRDALGDPDDVAILLFLQLDEGVEDAKVKLVHECVLHQLYLKLRNLLVSQLPFMLDEKDAECGGLQLIILL